MELFCDLMVYFGFDELGLRYDSDMRIIENYFRRSYDIEIPKRLKQLYGPCLVEKVDHHVIHIHEDKREEFHDDVVLFVHQHRNVPTRRDLTHQDTWLYRSFSVSRESEPNVHDYIFSNDRWYQDQVEPNNNNDVDDETHRSITYPRPSEQDMARYAPRFVRAILERVRDYATPIRMRHLLRYYLPHQSPQLNELSA